MQAQLGDANSLHAFYKALIGLRNSVPALARGGFERSVVVGSAHGFVRRLGDERALVVINYGGGVTDVAMAGLPAGATLAAAWPAGGGDLVVDSSGAVSVTVDAQAVRVYTVR